MKRTPVRIAVASAMAAAIAVGTVSAAEAKPRTISHAHAVKSNKARAQAQAAARRAGAAAHRLAVAKANVVRAANIKLGRLTRADQDIVAANLGSPNTDTVRANIAADKTALQAAAQSVASATTLADVAKVAATVASYRPENYEIVKDLLVGDNAVTTEVAAVQQTITQLTAQAATTAAAGGDVTAVQADLATASTDADQAAAAAAASVAKALTVTATTPKAAASSPLHLAAVEAEQAATAVAAAEVAVQSAQTALAAVVLPAPAPTAPVTTTP